MLTIKNYSDILSESLGKTTNQSCEMSEDTNGNCIRTLTIKQWNNLENSKEFHGYHRCHEQKALSVKDKKLASF